MSSPVYEIPNGVNVHGLHLHADVFKPVVDKGTDFDEVQLNENDILIPSYPRTGTTWLSQIVTLLMAGDEDYDKVNAVPIQERSIFPDMARPGDKAEIDRLVELSSPRIVKTHLTYPFVNRWVERDHVKAIVPLRNPKDTMVSYYHFYQTIVTLFDFKGTWNDFFQHVQTGNIYNGDPVDWMLSWWEHRNLDNILIIKYEDMLMDLPKEMNRIIKFLGLKVSEETFNRCVKDSSFKSMGDNPSTNYTNSKLQDHSRAKFIRSGQVAQWKKFFTVAQNDWFDEKYLKKLEDSGLTMTFE